MSWFRIALIIVPVSVVAGAVVTLLAAAGIRGGEDAVDAEREGAAPVLRDPPVTFSSLPPGYCIENVVSGIEAPTALDGAPDGRIFVTEQFSGRVRVIRDGALLPEPFWVAEDVYPQPGRRDRR